MLHFRPLRIWVLYKALCESGIIIIIIIIVIIIIIIIIIIHQTKPR